MYLFFDGVSTQGYIALFSQDREIIAQKRFKIFGNESTKTIPIIDEFLSLHDLKYENLYNISCVVGPGSFTGIRTISLVVNTLAYTYPHISLTAINFFDMYEAYPIVKASSKRDLFVKYQQSDIIEIVKNEDFCSNFSGNTIYGDIADINIIEKYTVISDIDYKNIITKLSLDSKKQVAPLYIKKPNIS